MYGRQVIKLALFLSIFLSSIIFLFSTVNAQKAVPEKEKYGGNLIIAVPEDFKSLDSRYLPGSSSARGEQHLYNPLVEVGPKGVHQVIPALATDWKRTDDLTWIVHLRKGVKFHNGKEITSEDVAKNFDWMVNAKKYLTEKGWRRARGANNYEQIKSVEAVDKYTLKFTLKYPFPPFPVMSLNQGSRGIIDPDIVEKYEKQATLYPVGTGPFKFREWVSGDHMVIERFEDYWGGKPYLDRVIFRIIPDAQTRFIALQKGEVDIAVNLLLSQVAQIEKDPNLKYNKVGEARRGGIALWFNLRRWPANQLKFRQAVAMGADWEKIVKAVFPKGTEEILRTMFQGTPLENPEAKKLVPLYNPQKAKQLLKEVEKEGGKLIPSIYAMAPSGYKQDILANVLTIAVEQLKQIGLRSDLYIHPSDVHRDKMRRDPKEDWDISTLAFIAPALDGAEAVSDFYSKTANAGDGQNIPGYNNPEVDKLILKGGATYDEKERKRIYQEIEKIILKDLVIFPIFEVPGIYGYNKRVHDFPAHDSAKVWICTPWNNIWLEKKVK